MIRIGIITPYSSLNWIKSIEEYLEENYKVVYIPYKEPNEIKNVYLQNQAFFDGFIFSGQLPYYTAKKELSSFDKPVVYFDITERDFYKMLCKTMLEHKNFSFSRTLIDFIFKQDNYLGLTELLKEDEFPYIFSEDWESYGSDTIYEDLFDRHSTLWEQGKINISFTRASNLSKKLSEHNIKHIVLNPSKESMLEKISELIKEIELNRLLENQMAFGIISIKDMENVTKIDGEIEFKQILLNKAILEFNKKHGYSFIIQKNVFTFEVITSFKDLKSITNNFKMCTLLNFFNTNLPFKVEIGWGTGHTIEEAKMNAVQANTTAKRNVESSTTYIMTENEHLIGPIGDEHCLDISNESNPKIENLSQQLGISSLQIQKLLAVMEKLNTNEVMVDDIANSLGVTIRTANRILNKLEEKGAAEVTLKKQKKLKGRPGKLYKIDFQKQLE